MSPDFHSGFLAYDNWIHALSSAAEAKIWAAQYIRHLVDSWGEMPGLSDIADRFEEIAMLYRAMMLEIMSQDWDGAKHLGKPVTHEQAIKLIPCLQKAKILESEAVLIIKNGMKL